MAEEINKEFHKWLDDEADGWVKAVAGSDTVYQAMKSAWEAGKDSTNG